jgi:imidazolonepropionase
MKTSSASPPALRSHSGNAILLVNVGQLLTLRSESGEGGARHGAQLQELGVIKDAAVLCVAGKIVAVGRNKDALNDVWIRKNRPRILELDCQKKVVLPGLVDSHTHPAFIAPRLVDFEKRVAGASYEEIAEAGGGIRSSVDGVRRASKAELSEHVSAALAQFARFGTTTVEAKSGYGLSLDAEMKSLEAIQTAAAAWAGSVAPTLLAAHVVPSEYRDRPQEYVDLICRRMIPEVAKRKLATFVDVFCDRGAFSADEATTILSTARNHGLQTRVHVSQLTRTPLQNLLSMQPSSVDHLDHVDGDDVRSLAKSNSIAVLVPGANYFLGLKKYPPARTLIEAGAAVALATDYNPGSSPTASMPFVLSLACTQMRMTPAEAIVAATLNGAHALGLGASKGSIEPGKDADLAIFDVSDFREIAYWVGGNPCESVIAKGVRVRRALRET